MYFEPYEVKLGISNQEYLVDGAIIAENPSLYSAILAREFHKRNFIRVVSLGSGMSNFEDIDFTSGNFVRAVLDDTNHIIDFFNNIKANAHGYYTKILAGESNYHRFDF